MWLCGVHSEVGCDSLVGDPLVVLADPNGVNLCPSLGRPHLPSILDVQAFKGKDGMAFFCRKRECGCMVCIVSVPTYRIFISFNVIVSCTHTPHSPHLFVAGSSDGGVLLCSIERCSTGRSSQNKQQEESGPHAHSCDLFHLTLSPSC